jgi:predicted esterase
MHEEQQLVQSGVALDQAKGAVIMLHGRGGEAADMISLSKQFAQAGVAILAPSAHEGSWFPYSFLVPPQQNEPKLSSAMTVVNSLVMEAELSGVITSRIFLFGFDQGACLALEYMARNPRPLGGLIALSGGLIGPQGTNWESEGSMAGTPVFIGCSDVDPHTPRDRLEESAEVFRALGARVFLKLYPGMGHTINGAEIKAAQEIIAKRMAPEPTRK